MKFSSSNTQFSTKDNDNDRYVNNCARCTKEPGGTVIATPLISTDCMGQRPTVKESTGITLQVFTIL